MRTLLFMLFVLTLASCNRPTIFLKEDKGLTQECKGDRLYGYYCKATTIKNKVSYCFKTEPEPHSVPCEFYEDL